MFKLESYITPLILSYVDKYIKNFRPEDSQVSLWGGDASFHNLDLRLEVLEQELQLPFSFVSGHIHELLIHVPWTKLTSEPITITINTIECILKLRGTDKARSPDSQKERPKKIHPGKKNEVEAPPSYVQSLINKIVSNIRIYCNNLILKYVEEDIVLSMNVKLLTFESCNEKWEPSYTDYFPAQITMRKLISINNLTVCLDKRNASGKIDVYQEPMLYRCSLVMHLLRNYHTATSKRASTTRLDVYCNNMEFSMTEQQIPMLMRLILLVCALNSNEFKNESEVKVSDDSYEVLEPNESNKSWAGWMWSFVPSILPTSEENGDEHPVVPTGHTLHIGCYVDNASLVFKVSESCNERGYYSQRKLKYWPLLLLKFQGLYTESIMHGLKWINVSAGIAQVIVQPLGCCTCAFLDVPENTTPLDYFTAGSETETHKTDSLFDVEAVENKGQKKLYNVSWEYHLGHITETTLLERTPALAVDFVSDLVLPDDMTSEQLSDIGSDYEYSNISLRTLLRVVVGPFRLRLCAGFIHRVQCMQAAASAYDYAPYSVPKMNLSKAELLPPSSDDYDALNENIPKSVVQYTVIAPVIEFQLFDHPRFESTKECLFRKRKKVSTVTPPSNHTYAYMPKLTIECQCIDVKVQRPIYTKRLVQTVCQLPSPPTHMFEACYKEMSIKLIGFCSRLILSNNRSTTIVVPFNATFNSRSIIFPEYWTDSDILHHDLNLHSDSISITTTKPKAVLAVIIIDKLIKMNCEEAIHFISNTSILHDATKDCRACLEICIEDMKLSKVTTNTTFSLDVTLGAIKAFIFDPLDHQQAGDTPKNSSHIESMSNCNFHSTRDIQQVLFISGPDMKNVNEKNEEIPLFKCLIQFPLDPSQHGHPSIVMFNLQEIRICVDPLLCQWFLYAPIVMHQRTDFGFELKKPKTATESNSSVMDTPRRLVSTHESVHSSSDRDPVMHIPKIQKHKEDDEHELPDLQERIYNFLKRWFSVWKGMMLFGDISQCTIYFPTESLSAIGSQGIQQAIDEAMLSDNPADILVITLPNGKIRSAGNKKSVLQHIKTLPIKLPQTIWSPAKSNFPWSISISDISCYSWQKGTKLDLLKPVSLNATVGLCTKAKPETAAAPVKKDFSPPSEKQAGDKAMDNAVGTSIASVASCDIKPNLGTLGICVHVDMSPTNIIISEVQVSLIASILYGLIEVYNNLTPDTSEEPLKSPEVLPVINAQGSSSPTLMKESTLETASEQGPHVTINTDIIDSDSIKLTAWIQWTITRFSIEMLSYKMEDFFADEFNYTQHPSLKLLVEAEDVVSSLDFQSVYLKIKSKVGSASIQHYFWEVTKSEWKAGPYLGFIMKTKEDVPSNERREDTCFANIIVTRASCQHTHNLWGKGKAKINEKEEPASTPPPSRFITEIVITLRPIDFLLSLSTLRSFYMVFEPLLQIPLPTRVVKEADISSHVNNRVLPLAYIECMGFRIIVPSMDLGIKGGSPDVCIFQVESVNLMPEPANPICRTPLRADIYQQAARSRILHIPGSEIEDRQYELNVSGISLSTSTWAEFDPVLNIHSSSTKHLKTMSENPALEWNLGKGRFGKNQHINLVPIVNKFDLLVITAPAMIFKKDVICGHSIEINFVTNVDVQVSLSQIKLLNALQSEFYSIFELVVSEGTASRRPKVYAPYMSFRSYGSEGDEISQVNSDMFRDSGIETSDFRSTVSFKTVESVQLRRISGSENLFSRTSTASTQGFIPVDVLITAGKLGFVLYDQTSDNLKDTSYYGIRKKPLLKDFDNDKGYDGSEESSIEEKAESKRRSFEPLIFASVCQPNAFMSDLPYGRKIQISCFDVKVKLPTTDKNNLKFIPNEKDFGISLIDTRSGQPNPSTGVLPAFFTLRWSKGIGKPNLDMEIAKPVQFLTSTAICTHLFQLKNKVVEVFHCDNVIRRKSVRIITPKSASSLQKGSVLKRQKSVENYVKFKQIKEKLFGVSILNVKLAQIVLKIKTENENEVTLIIGKLKNHLNISNRPERITNVTSLSCISLGISNGDVSHLVLNPWTISLEVCLFWESWQGPDSDPQIQISADSDCIMIDMSPDQLQCIELVNKEVTNFINSLPFNKRDVDFSDSLYEDVQKNIPSDKEQHYKDDLRAGAFHFVDSTSNNIDELPLPYQVMFWNKNISAMAWRYPQPRALTKIRVFPVPFKITQDSNETQRILCHLEYWSECHGCYQSYTQFYLSESEMCHLDLPQNNQPAVACAWRIVLSSINNDDDEYSYTRVLLSPRALAGCIRVDSYFNKVLVPQLTLALHISTISISLYNRIDKNNSLIMPERLKLFTSDQLFPEKQNFMTLSLDNTRAYLATWNFDTFSFDLTSHLKCQILDYSFLTMQPLVFPFGFKFETSISNSVNVNFISKPIHVNFGATAAHTLAVSTQMWAESWKNGNQTNLIMMTQYAICNDTNVSLRFGQAGYEDILLLPRNCNFYAWRSQKCKLMLRVALEEFSWIWSEPFRIDCDGTEILKISTENNLTIIVTVKSLSATQKQVIFSGQLVICNTLLEHFEMKVMENSEKDKDKVFKNAATHIISGKSTPPSVLINASKKYFLRLRFYGLESAWSGDIPLAANPKCAQPWLVKVPLQERGQFLSIWCQIVMQAFDEGIKVLAILSPLFMVRSNLPVNSRVHIETPMLNVHLESTVRGKGEYQQLYCPGTIDHSHQLTFQLDDLPTSNPYVPLNYSLVDQKDFFKKDERINIDEILEVLSNYDKSSWPYFGEDYEGLEFLIEEQPLTHVQVRYQNACLHSSALLVELLPWCLMLNTLGCAVAVIINEKELCRVNHYGICTPPKLDETFYLGVGIGGMWNLSSPLQLAKSDWGSTFYMPKITGTIPVDGTITTTVKCEPYICTVSISSCMENAIRLLRVSSTHVLTNHTSMQLFGVCFAVPDTGTAFGMPKKLDRHTFTINPNLSGTNSGISITQWYVIGKTVDPNVEYVFYIAFSTSATGTWSCPVRVDKTFTRRNISIQTDQKSIPIVLVSQEYKGQTFLSLHYDSHPQLQLKNRSGVRLFCAQFAEQESRFIIDDCEHLKWLCCIEDEGSCYYTMPDQSAIFPDVAQAVNADHLVFASDPEGDPQGFQWSQPVNVTNFNDQFVRIPFYGDVKVLLSATAHTTILFIESVSQVEISARDIRVRLSMHENEQHSITNIYNRRDARDEDETNTIPSTYFSAEEGLSDSSSVNRNLICQSQTLPTLAEHSNLNLEFTNTPTSSDFDLRRDPMLALKCKGTWNNFKVQVFIKAAIVTLTSDLDNCGAEKMEFCALTCDNIALIVNRTDNVEVSFSISNVQLDNQLYYRGSYDFPVILISQHSSQNQPLNSLNVPINQLIGHSQKEALVTVLANFEIWADSVQQTTMTDMKDMSISIKPLAAFIEDVYISKLMEYMNILFPTNLIMWRKSRNSNTKFDTSSSLVSIPAHISWGSTVYANAISLRSFVIEPLSVLLSVHCSIKLYVALDQSPLQFGKFEKKKVITTPYRLGHATTMHYLSGAIFGAGWVVGSLELLGSPGGLARAMGVGLRDFVSLPYQGFLQGPWAFLVGITHGSASLMKHITAGTLQSVTKLASSVARNLDRLTLDEEHLKRTEEQRRQRPQGVTQGFMQGLTGFGISLLGAVGGIAHHPLQSLVQDGASPRSLVAGVGLGLVGMFTKPLSGAADLVALTGQGLLQGAGWNTLPESRMKPALSHVFSSNNSLLKYNWKFMQPVTKPSILFVTEATCITNYRQYEAVALILTSEVLIIVNTDDDMTQKMLKLDEFFGVENNSDPTLLMLKLITVKPETAKIKYEDDCPVELDPISRARIQDYVRNTVGLMNFADDESSQHSDISISPDISVDDTKEENQREPTCLTFYVNPQNRNYFLCLLSLAKQQYETYNFPVL